jgi:hypothetical protein
VRSEKQEKQTPVGAGLRAGPGKSRAAAYSPTKRSEAGLLRLITVSSNEFVETGLPVKFASQITGLRAPVSSKRDAHEGRLYRMFWFWGVVAANFSLRQIRQNRQCRRLIHLCNPPLRCRAMADKLASTDYRVCGYRNYPLKGINETSKNRKRILFKA